MNYMKVCVLAGLGSGFMPSDAQSQDGLPHAALLPDGAVLGLPTSALGMGEHVVRMWLALAQVVRLFRCSTTAWALKDSKPSSE